MRLYSRKKFVGLFMVLLALNFLYSSASFAKPKKIKVSPASIIVSADQVPENLKSLAVPLTFKTKLVNISAVESDVEDVLAVFGQNGVGVIKTTGSLPSMFNFTVTFKGLKKGNTKISVGEVTDKIGGTAIEGAVASTTATKIRVK